MPKITVSKTPLPAPSRGRAAIENPYKSIVLTFNDGKTRTVKCDATEKPASEIGRLRAAAKELSPPRGVRAVIDEATNSFDFVLIEFTARPRKAKGETTDGETHEHPG